MGFGKKSRVLKVTLLTVTAVLALDLAAGLFFIDRTHVPTIRTFHSYYHHGLREYMNNIEPWSPTHKYTMYTNSLGFRDGECDEHPARTEKRRVVFLGDSFTEGVGVDFEDTFVGIIEKRLEPHTEVLNAAVVSYGATIYYLKTKYLIEERGLKFDELIVFSDISDVYNDYALNMIENFTPSMTTPVLASARLAADKWLNRYSFIYHSFRIIYPYVKLRKYEKGFAWWTLDDKVFNDWGKEGLRLSGEYMQRLVDLCKQHGVRMTIVVYPWTNLIEERDLNSRQVVFWREFSARNEIGFIDLFPVFIDETPAQVVLDAYFIPNDIHWNKAGHKLVAATVLKHMDQKRRL